MNHKDVLTALEAQSNVSWVVSPFLRWRHSSPTRRERTNYKFKCILVLRVSCPPEKDRLETVKGLVPTLVEKQGFYQVIRETSGFYKKKKIGELEKKMGHFNGQPIKVQRQRVHSFFWTIWEYLKYVPFRRNLTEGSGYISRPLIGNLRLSNGI